MSIAATLFSTLWAVTLPADTAPDHHFERKVRPLLVERCQSCHGAKQQQGSIRLDGGEFLAKPGDGGSPLVIAGNPDESRLIKAIRHADGVAAMPEGKPKLSEPEITELVRWVKEGAKWPAPTPPSAAKPNEHWAFKGVSSPDAPEVKDGDWPAGDIDRFVLARLEAKNLKPSPDADRRTLLRRLRFDLTGLPPSANELTEFERDQSPEAIAKVVDRLLASPEFGERWGRHWLDIARYAETSGTPVVDEDVRYPFAYSYRDWVVRAFNRDLPYDEFVRMQIAADRITPTEGDPDLAALGFLTLGRKFQGSEPDIIDDRLDVIFRGLQGVTISCARCHDHKYDPIPIRDYYSLYGVLQNVSERHATLISSPADRARQQVFEAERRARIRSFERFKDNRRQRLAALGWKEPAQYLLAAHSKEEVKVGDDRRREDGLDQQVVDKVRELLVGLEGDHHAVMAPWHAFSKLSADRFEAAAKKLAAEVAANADPEKQINPLVAALFRGPAPKSLDEVARRYGNLMGSVARKWQRKVAEADRVDVARPTMLEDEAEDEIRKLFFSEFPNFELSEEDLMNRLDDEPRKTFDRLRKAIGDWDTGPDAPPHARILVDPEEPSTPNVHIRGKEDQQGEEVPRQFPAAIDPKRKPFEEGTGRGELARAIGSKENPLTARVWVNRVWGHLLGRSIVTTASDFGLRSSAPSHPELLDWLAARLMEDEWSTKKLIRRIVLSRTYRQASAERADGRSLDPENALLWRMNRRRLEFEPLRDAMLVAGGNLDRTSGGRSDADLGKSLRRSLYLTVDRGALAGVFRTFDFANPDLSSPGRHETTVPQQSLFLLNNPFVIEQARRLAARVEATSPKDEIAQVNELFTMTLGRAPSSAERNRMLGFLTAAGKLKEVGAPPPTSPWRYGRGTWKADTRTVGDFVPFEFFADNEWRPAAQFPDTKRFGYLQLTEEGGIPGETPAESAVRRWVAPTSGPVRIRGRLKHQRGEDVKPADTDGLRGHIALNGASKLSVDVNNGEAKTDLDLEVKAGDVIDFVADPKSANDYDGFTWIVSLTLKSGGREIGFDSAEDYAGPPPPPEKPLSPREKLAQVLLMSAEFAFID
jgi:hypothetical protein